MQPPSRNRDVRAFPPIPAIPTVPAISAVLVAMIASLSLFACGPKEPKPGTVIDEAMQAKRSAASFPAADEDYFHDMDGALPLTREQIQGRNMWLVWTGGNDRMWNVL